jgi:hypothetical protein
LEEGAMGFRWHVCLKKIVCKVLSSNGAERRAEGTRILCNNPSRTMPV